MPTQLIRLTLHDGDPEGLRSAAIAGRSTLLLASPWNQFGGLKGRDEARRPAVYFLVGPTKGALDGGTAEQTIYIGECDSLIERFAGGHHKAAAAEWSQIFVATTLEDTFNRAHARLAEHRLVAAAKDAKRAVVLNGGTGPGKLSDGDAAFAAEFVSNVIILAQTLGLSLFRPAVTTNAINEPMIQSVSAKQVFEFAYTKQHIPAQMVLDGASFVVKAGSLALEANKSLQPSFLARRNSARQAGILVQSGTPGLLRFTSDYPTNSSSTAGMMVSGSHCNGPDVWRHVGTGQTYREWLAAKIDLKEMLS